MLKLSDVVIDETEHEDGSVTFSGKLVVHAECRIEPLSACDADHRAYLVEALPVHLRGLVYGELEERVGELIYLCQDLVSQDPESARSVEFVQKVQEIEALLHP